MIKEIYAEKLKIKNIDSLEDGLNKNHPDRTQIINNHNK